MGRVLARKSGKRPYRKRFDLVCEGAKTEPQYFNWLKQHCDKQLVHISIAPMRTGKSSPYSLIKKATDISSEVEYQRGDQIWIILDTDQWKDEHFRDLSNWRSKNLNRNHIAVSNPKFEYWVLMHLENNPAHLSGEKCSKLYQEFMGSKKGFDSSKLPIDSVSTACERARQKFESGLDGSKQEFDFVPNNCGSTLFELIDALGQYLSA